MRIVRANVRTSTLRAPPFRSADAAALAVAPVVYTSSTSATRAGTRPCARNAPATFRRRSCCVSPRWRGDPLALVRNGCTGSPHSAASSVASRSAAWCPRFSLRSGSPGTKTTHAATGRGIDSRTTAAAHPASRRRPRSFQAITTWRSRSSYTSTARACANASRRPAHSPQRCTGQAVGAPQRAQSGGSMRRNAAVHLSQTCAPGSEHTRQH